MSLVRELELSEAEAGDILIERISPVVGHRLAERIVSTWAWSLPVSLTEALEICETGVLEL